MKIAILDDEINFMYDLKDMLYNHLGDDIEISYYMDGYDFLEDIYEFDILFLDYEMPFLNGIEVLEKIDCQSLKKVMVSQYDNMVFDTYQFEIYWFIRKRHLENDFSKFIIKLKEDLKNEDKKLSIRSLNKQISLSFEDIYYLYTSKNYVYICSKVKTFKIRSTFSSIKEQFDNHIFVIPIYGVIVNMKYIKYIDFNKLYVLMNDDQQITISRTMKKEVYNCYGRFISQ